MKREEGGIGKFKNDDELFNKGEPLIIAIVDKTKERYMVANTDFVYKWVQEDEVEDI